MGRSWAAKYTAVYNADGKENEDALVCIIRIRQAPEDQREWWTCLYNLRKGIMGATLVTWVFFVAGFPFRWVDANGIYVVFHVFRFS